MFFQEKEGILDNAKNSLKEFNNGVDALNKATGILDANVLKIGASLARLAFPVTVIEDTAKLQELTYELTTQAMGQTGIIGDALMESMGNATYQTTQFGVGLEENLNLLKAINEKMQVNTLLSSEQVVNMQLLARNAGVTANEIVPIVEGFATIGMGTDEAISNISTMQKQARDYGINVGQFMKGISDNIKMLSSYNFADGIEGFSRMVAKAQALRFDVSKTFALSEKLMDPEQAIETAAGFQMLGGAVGDLGDPFKLLQMAQTDAEGLQESIFDMAESAVVFNKKTGKFDIPVTEMYRLREAANLTGIDYQTLTETAIKAAERTKKLDLLSTIPEVPDDFKDLIANMGDIDASGQLVVSIPSFDEMGNKVSTQIKKASELDSNDLDALKEMSEKNAMSDRDIAMSQLTALQKLAYGQDSAKASTLLAGVNTKGVYDALDALDAFADTTLEGLNKSINEDNMKMYGHNLTKAIAAGFQDETANREFRNIASHIALTMESAIVDSPDTMKEKLDIENPLKHVNIVDAITTQYGRLTGNLESMKSAFAGLIPNDLIDDLGLVGKGLGTIRDVFTAAINYSIASGGEILDDAMSGAPDYSPDTTPDKKDDFILRPGMDPISFNKDDLLIGGTDLFGEKRNMGYNDSNMDSLFNLGNTLSSFVSDNLGQTSQETQTIDYEGIINKTIRSIQDDLITSIPTTQEPLNNVEEPFNIDLTNYERTFTTAINTLRDDLITSIPTTQEPLESLNKLSELGSIIENTMSENKVGGEVNLNVGGKIDLSVDGRNLPQNISSEQLANEIVNNPNFTSKLMAIFTDKNNTYSV